ncbi:hydrolase [Lichenicoccus sp.]|uniref:hydrolase n=1 Tax=Lichenicoccus sp. TaxID=2781899 RepID=UPI003D0D5F3E
MPDLDPATTALVLIDLQNGIIGMDVAPRTGPDTVAAGQALATRFRTAGAPVVLVHVAFAPDFSDAPPGLVDQALSAPPGGLPAQWSELAEGLAQPGDLLVRKRQWGAFTGTELDLLLRRRGIGSVVIGGIATNFGVESTARHAWELGYHVVIAEDACTSVSAEAHGFAITHVLPRVARVVQIADISLPRRA